MIDELSMASDLDMHIDLYNLEDEKFEGSKYVLTSPRSLEACSHLDVKPVELLYKPLSEFQEAFLPQDIPLRQIYALYDESEQIRQKKLRLCREEHSRIISLKAKQASKLATKAYLSTLPSEDYELKIASDKKKTMSISPSSYKTIKRMKNYQRSIDRESPKLHRELLSKKEKNQGKSIVRPQSAEQRKSQRCSSSVTIGSKVRYRCGSAPNVLAKLPARDEKILKLMTERRKGEINNLEISDQAHRLWEDQKKREEVLRLIAENKRRQLLVEENRIKDKHKAEEQKRRLRAADEERQIRLQGLQDSQLKAEINVMNQLRMQELTLEDKIQKEAAQKSIQQLNLRANEKQDETVSQLLLAKQKSDLLSAAEKRDVMIHQDILKKFLDNRQEREQFEQRHSFLKSQEELNKELVKSSLETRLSQAEANLEHVLQQRNRRLEEQHREEQSKLYRVQSSYKKLETEMEDWRFALLQQKKQMEDRASEAVSHNIELKSWQARKSRTAKQMKQKKNIFRIQKDEERHKKVLERSLLAKDRKLENLMEEREKTIAQTRAMAQLSQSLRDDIKEKYMSDTFDKKVLEAEIYAKLNKEPRSKSPTLKNRSSVKFC